MRDQVISAGNSIPPPSVRLTFQLSGKGSSSRQRRESFSAAGCNPTAAAAAVAQQLDFFGGGMSSANNQLKLIFLSKLSDIFI